MASTLRKAQRTTINRALNTKTAGNSLGQHRNTPALAMEALLDAGYTEKQTLKLLKRAGVALPPAEVVAEAEHDWAFYEAAHYDHQAMIEQQLVDNEVAYTMQMTEAPVGTCDDCGLDGGHVMGCTVAACRMKIEHVIPTQVVIATQHAQCLACARKVACRLITRVKNTGLGLCPDCEVAAPDLAAKASLVEVTA